MHLWIDQKYIGLLSLKLERFKQKSEKLYNFRCPFCGDSQKDKTKARGYLFKVGDTYAYKCHNCSASASLTRLIGAVDPSLATAYRMECFAGSKPTGPIFMAAKQEPQVQHKNDVLCDLGLTRLVDMDADSRVVSYVSSRKIPHYRWSDLYYARDYRVCEKLNPAYENRLTSEERLVIPFYDNKGYLSGVSGRALGNSKIRYQTIRITDFPMIYGLNRVNKSKLLHIVEGPIDSMFLDNAIAAGGSDLQTAMRWVSDCMVVLIFDNEPRNPEIVKLMERMIERNATMVVWPQNWLYKDINDAIISGVSQNELENVIHTNTFYGMQLKLAIKGWKRT